MSTENPYHVKVNISAAKRPFSDGGYRQIQEPIELWLKPGVTYTRIEERTLNQAGAEELAADLLEASRVLEDVASRNPVSIEPPTGSGLQWTERDDEGEVPF